MLTGAWVSSGPFKRVRLPLTVTPPLASRASKPGSHADFWTEHDILDMSHTGQWRRVLSETSSSVLRPLPRHQAS